MANQFGDSLANMEVAPGKSIPFVVVVANLPKGAKDFEVQPAGINGCNRKAAVILPFRTKSHNIKRPVTDCHRPF